jgi:hypothetical protein
MSMLSSDSSIHQLFFKALSTFGYLKDLEFSVCLVEVSASPQKMETGESAKLPVGFNKENKSLRLLTALLIRASAGDRHSHAGIPGLLRPAIFWAFLLPFGAVVRCGSRGFSPGKSSLTPTSTASRVTRKSGQWNCHRFSVKTGQADAGMPLLVLRVGIAKPLFTSCAANRGRKAADFIV